MKYLIKNIRYGITEGGVACGPIDGNVVASVEFKNGNDTFWLSLVEVYGLPEFYFSEEDIFDGLLGETEEFYTEKADNLFINEFNGISLESYEDILKAFNESHDEDDKSLIKLIIDVVRLDFDETDKLIEESIGKDIADIDIPALDLEEDM